MAYNRTKFLTVGEAISELGKPSFEDARSSLLEMLVSYTCDDSRNAIADLPSFLQDEESGVDWQILFSAWNSHDGRWEFDWNTGLAQCSGFALVDIQDRYDPDRLKKYSGRVLIDRTAFERLTSSEPIAQSGEYEPTMPSSKPSRQIGEVEQECVEWSDLGIPKNTKSYRWEDAFWAVVRFICSDPDGLPEIQARLVDALMDWFDHTHKKSPSRRSVERVVGDLYGRIQTKESEPLKLKK